MESSALYESALTFMQPHQIFFLKIISDYLNDSFNENHMVQIKSALNNASEIIISWMNDLKSEFKYDKEILSPKDIEIIDT